jgi:hypothetical protein
MVADAELIATTVPPATRGRRPAISERIRGGWMERPNTSVADQPSVAAFLPQSSRKRAASSTTADQVSIEIPSGGGSTVSRANPSAHSRGTSAPYSTRAARSSKFSVARMTSNSVVPVVPVVPEPLTP